MSAEFFKGLLSLRSKLIYAGGVCGRWAIDHNSDTAIWFHLLTNGDAWVHYPSRSERVALGTGDVIAFLPHAEKHYLSYSENELRFDDPQARKTSFEQGTTGFVCTLIEIGAPHASFWQALPAEVVIRKHEAGSELADLARYAVEESYRQRFASFAVIERLCDNIFLLMLRQLIERGALTEGVLAAMHDKRIETALSLIHREPWQPWTVAKLGGRVGLSKTTLNKHFAELVGCAPGEYLTRWRMQVAANWLTESRIGIEVVAERCGYFSVAAFGRAFKRCYGVGPGEYRRGRLQRDVAGLAARGEAGSGLVF